LARVTLERVVAAVLDRNPSVAAARARWKAALEKHPQALTLPDPMVQFRKFTRDADFPDGRARVETMLTQAIPFPARIALEGDLAVKEAALARVHYDAALRDAVVEARDAFHELQYLDRAREVVAATREILARYATVAAGDLDTGRTKLPEEFRARALLAQAGYDLTLLEELRRAEEQRLRGLLALPPGTPLGPVEPVGLVPVATPLPEVLRLAEARSQELAAAGLELEKASVTGSLARWEYAPELLVGAEWMRNDMQDPARGTFRDGRTVLLGLSVPIWFPARTARVREADALRDAAAFDRAAEVERVRTAVARAYFRANNAERLALLYRDTLIPQAGKSLRLAEALYRDGKASLAGSIETALAWENFQLAYHRALADHGQAVAMLEQVVGAAVTPPALPAGDAPAGGSR